MKWKNYRISEICTFSNGKSKSEDLGQYPVYGGNGIMGSSSDYNFENGLVIGRVGAYCGNVYKAINKCWVSDNAIAAKINTGFDINFIYYLLSKADLHNFHTGGAQPLMTQDIVGRIEVNVPSIDEQKRIGNILSHYDELIDLNNRRVALLEKNARELYKEWFVRMRFPGWENAKFVDGLPEGWTTRAITDILDVRYGKDHKSLNEGVIPVYGSGGIMRFADKFIFDGESVLIPRKGTLNNIMYVNGKFWTIDTMFYAVQKIEYTALLCYYFLSFFDMEMFNSGAALPSMTTNILGSIKMTLPNKGIRKRFYLYISKIKEAVVNLRNQNSLLTTQRDRLIPRLMSGEIEV